MSAIQLQSSQKRVLEALVSLSKADERAVSGATIAAEVDRNPGTIRNQMQSLKALSLVEGIPGPKGGYKPTVDAYEVLDAERVDDPADVPVTRNGDPLPGLTVEEIDLTTVHDPERCRAEVVLAGSVRGFDAGDEVAVGPTPSTALRLTGVVDAVLRAEGTLTVDITEIATGAPAASAAAAGTGADESDCDDGVAEAVESV
ncbi:Rrf2 family transcriptional regulator [Halocalculus aciditolerans]|uniref:TrmB family transcriptional regulator n=1 Tax=Halocalculus aciditolerans TaxID=1383812 RepID=A0A830F7F3_9EURY|nr:Rrf2 family transcriptional regulator [Halocalculus aciditolerans]GGL70601.1 TrmB family transcriptional regulator [Halocalculus aciditolerans]